jgi:hypothetical protein
MDRKLLVRWVIRGVAVVLLVRGGAVFAEDPVAEPPAEAPSEEVTQEEAAMDAEAATPAGAARVTERLAQQFNVETSQIEALREQRMGYGEIHRALTLAGHMPGGITEENLAQITAMRQEQHMGWGRISQEVAGQSLDSAKHTPPPTEPPAPTEPSGGGTELPESPVISGTSSSAGQTTGIGAGHGPSPTHGHGSPGTHGAGAVPGGMGGGHGHGGGQGAGGPGGSRGHSGSAPGHNR